MILDIKCVVPQSKLFFEVHVMPNIPLESKKHAAWYPIKKKYLSEKSIFLCDYNKEKYFKKISTFICDNNNGNYFREKSDKLTTASVPWCEK